MELLHLRYFAAVAQELNFSTAARKLHMAASPLSRRIKDLENELGHRLFDRDTHHVRLTPAGSALLPIARGVLEQVDSIKWRLDETTRPQRTTLLLGVPTGIHPDLRMRIDALAERVRDRFEVTRWPGATDRLVDAVCDGRLALTLARLPVGGDPALEQLPVMSERLGAVVPRDAFPGRESVALAELADLAYAGSPAAGTHAYFRGLDQQLSDLGIKKRITLNSATFDGVSEIVSSGLAFSISMLDPKSPMHHYRLDNVTVLPFSDFHPRLETGLLWRQDRANGGDLEEVAAAAREIFAEPLHV
ncbi:putative LysR-family transcriptional regulator [Streptomyces himastatinicus ATCC 53653]|uniref:Putative LysR-family transcriptional regulator n=1 Tax=Streptomyces himastatinicus ATCC 53653 TaxID=457427 RepID=D9WP11_9ACTN|nr:LysR family transcriptional regulator [Streptomyces himastatinicus]EFL27984.1 putative LysR-family transcriptional regulator [Streptomyces himastatinicus ATCC 53653]